MIFLRFIAAGVVNTCASLAVYWLLLAAGMGPHPAYATAFVAGIASSYFLNTRLVFRAKHTLSRLLAFPLIYGIAYGAGAMVLEFAVEIMGIDMRLAPVLSLCATWPLIFVLMRSLLRPERGSQERAIGQLGISDSDHARAAARRVPPR